MYINKYYVLFFDGEPATLKATHGVKTPLNVDLGDASLQTSLAVTTRPSAASLNPASPIHYDDIAWNRESSKIIKSDKLHIYRLSIF